MRGHGRTAWRGGAVLGAIGLLAATVGGLPAREAKASAADLLDLVGAAAAPLSAEDMVTLPPDMTFSLSPRPE